MSLSDHQGSRKAVGLKSRRAFVGLAALGVVALGLSACNPRPVYSTGGGLLSSPAQSLAPVSVSPIASRVGIVLRNELVFALNGGQPPANPVYHLTVTISTVEQSLNIENQGSSGSSVLEANATYKLTKVEDGSVVTSGRSIGQSTFTYDTQQFAKQRAKRAAEDNATKVVADDIQARVSAEISRLQQQ